MKALCKSCYLRVAEVEDGVSSLLGRGPSLSLGGGRGYADGEGCASWGGAMSSAGAGPKRLRFPRGTECVKIVSQQPRLSSASGCDSLSFVPVTSLVAGLHILQTRSVQQASARKTVSAQLVVLEQESQCKAARILMAASSHQIQTPPALTKLSMAVAGASFATCTRTARATTLFLGLCALNSRPLG